MRHDHFWESGAKTACFPAKACRSRQEIKQNGLDNSLGKIAAFSDLSVVAC
jgi:hypothetical protein